MNHFKCLDIGLTDNSRSQKNIHVFQPIISIISIFRIPFKGLTRRIGRILSRSSSLDSPEAGKITLIF